MPLLEAHSVSSGYYGHPIVQDLDLTVDAGEVVALLGPNGAGKTTTILTLAGELKPLGGTVVFAGKPATAPLHRRVAAGLGLVTEERSVFMQLTTAENLRVGRCDTSHALELFPELVPLLGRRAGLLSGGEQQMLTLARALARRPRLLLVDELSLGLAPLVVRRLLQALRVAASEERIGVLIVEQHVKHALEIADRAYVMQRGRIALSGKAEDVVGRLEETYLTGASDGSSGRRDAGTS